MYRLCNFGSAKIASLERRGRRLNAARSIVNSGTLTDVRCVGVLSDRLHRPCWYREDRRVRDTDTASAF